MSPPAPSRDRWVEERAARERGFRHIAGVDEAGRGTLAGPVVAAAVILPPGFDPRGVRDSKTMTPLQRDRAFDRIMAEAVSVGVGSASAEEIDRINILRASQEAMRRAVRALPTPADCAIVDGLPVPAFPVPHFAVVKGDARSVSVAAASIVAKVTRDRQMIEADAEFPGYGFAEHKGYATPLHFETLGSLGPCRIHRQTFAPVREAGQQTSMELPSAAVGAAGETVAASHVTRLGWTVVATRYRCQGGEIDLVARDGDTVVFVEVKTRSGARYGAPLEAVDVRKRARMRLAAEAYLAEADLGDVPCRFDVADVRCGRDGLYTVTLVSGAFMGDE